MTTPAIYPHTKAVYDVLAAGTEPIGLNQAPKGGPPYGVLYQLPAVEADGPLNNPEADWLLQYQLTSVAIGPEQAQGTADYLRALIDAAGFLVVAGRSTWLPQWTRLGAPLRDDTVQPPLHFVTEDFQLGTTPA